MAFPTSPTDGQIFGQYIWQIDNWQKIESYQPSNGNNMGHLIILNHTERLNEIQLTVNSGSPIELDLSTNIPAGTKGVLINARPTSLSTGNPTGLMIWPANKSITNWVDADIFLWLDGFSTETGRNIHFDSLITRVSADYKIKYQMGSTVNSTLNAAASCVIQIRGYYI